MANESSQSLRLFYALWPDEATRAALQEWQKMLKGRHTASANFHITLAFLGEQPSQSLLLLSNILDMLPMQSMLLILEKIEYFPRSHIAWAGMHCIPHALIELQSRLRQALVQHNISFDNRPGFKPHVTLVRDVIMPSDASVAPIAWQASHVALVQSVMQSKGPIYHVLASRQARNRD